MLKVRCGETEVESEAHELSSLSLDSIAGAFQTFLFIDKP